MTAADVVDRLLEAPVFPSFTSIGSAVRSRLDDWQDVADYDLTGHTVLVTGATSGIGKAAAQRLVRCGADVIILGRTETKLAEVRSALDGINPNASVHHVVADMGELDAVRNACDEILATTDRLDAVMHNAGALLADRRETSTGTEVTVASQVLGPFLMTSLLLDRLRATSPGRVITMASGGLYSAPLRVDDMEMPQSEYAGAKQYAIAKRAQVTLNELWASKVPRADVVFHALHPGWVDTPGVDASLPTFKKIVGPLLRSPDDGADTMIWLAADDRATESSGDFWLDRRVRPIHRMASTRNSDTPVARAALWQRVVDQTGIDPLA